LKFGENLGSIGGEDDAERATLCREDQKVTLVYRVARFELFQSQVI